MRLEVPHANEAIRRAHGAGPEHEGAEEPAAIAASERAAWRIKMTLAAALTGASIGGTSA